MDNEFDAVVIGAGVAGSGIAYSLSKRGWNVALVDRETYPRHKACGEFLSPESVSSLKALGLDKVVTSLQPAAITTVRLHTERGASLEIPLPGTAMGISRYSLDARLQLSVAQQGGSMFSGSPVSAVKPFSNGYRVDIASDRGTTRFFSRTVIAAWGRRSLHGFHPHGSIAKDSSYVGIKSHYTRSDSDAAVDLYFFRGGYIGLSPVEGGRMNVAALLTRASFRRLGGSGAVQTVLESAATRIPALRKRLEHATSIPGTHASTFPVNVTPRLNAWNELPCIGDALAVIPPFCGDGMSMALRSVELCAPLADDYLRGYCTRTEWKNVYTRLIEQQFTGALRWGSRFERILTHIHLSTWLFRLGSIAPGAAERMVRATRLRG
ncbi:NAD(P)/FAD-dependent oxidoreductase [Cohnella cholangitidis]|uniref:NAD(P)/FAD-dependent oxidoreductase n=1 Tax=Cohnella cholangitidis TaxID=2598458 RepID=UPI0015F8AE9B|nr:FAD-dependent oxidoreductase [Cohnella cholangitidis]